jgi:tetratricopeptide (TPR) repeat protein
MTAIANLSMLEGKLDEAQQHAELMLKSEPGQAHEIMARIAAQRGDFARAQKEGEEAAAKMSDPTAALQTLGLISKQRGDMQAAMKYLDQALARVAQKRNKRVPNLHLYRGDILARLGRNQEAETEFRREIGLYPKQPDAYASLILLLSAEHRVDEATNLVFTLVKESPNPPSYVAISETLKAIGDDRGSMYWAYQGLQKYPHDPELQRLLRGGRRVS